MNFLNERIVSYAEEHSSFNHAILEELERETHLKTMAPQMISGKIQGQFLHFLTSMIKPQYAVEIGTFTGYSAFCIAMGMTSASSLITIESNEEYSFIFDKYKSKLGLDHIELRLGDAKELIPKLSPNIDMVFIDASKKEYPEYYELLLPKLSTHGVMLIDNVLWYGKVVEEKKPIAKNRLKKWKLNPPVGPSVEAVLKEFNQKLANDDRVQNFLLPLRDGVQCVIKK